MQMPPKRQVQAGGGRRSGLRLTGAAPIILLLAANPTVVRAQTPAAAVPPPAAAPASPAISVTVDGQPVTFAGQGPVLDPSGGSVLVPLRGVFEKLGAGVQYAGETHTITAVKGDTTVSLRLGDPNAFVNGMPHPLSVAPRMLNGSTMVPLRFVSEALGAVVKWDAVTQIVDIVTPKPPDNTPVTGTVVTIDAGARTLTVHPAAGDKDVPLTLIADAPLLIKTGDAPAVSAPDLTTVRVGDQVTVKRNDAGLGFSLEADYDERKGVVKSVDAMPATGNPKITFADDSVAEIAPGAPILRGTDPINLPDIVAGQKAVLRVNPVTHVASAVVVEIPKVEAVSITQSAGARLLKAGDEVTVTLIGTPGAKAVFNVPGIAPLTGQPLTESTETAGTYNGSFKVPGGVTLENASISGTLSLAGVTSPAVQATANLNIDSTGPTFADLTPMTGSNGTGLRPESPARTPIPEAASIRRERAFSSMARMSPLRRRSKRAFSCTYRPPTCPQAKRPRQLSPAMPPVTNPGRSGHSP